MNWLLGLGGARPNDAAFLEDIGVDRVVDLGRPAQAKSD